MARDRRANRASDRAARLTRSQIIRNFELHALPSRSAVANIERVAPRVLLTLRIDREPGFEELLRESRCQVRIESSDMDPGFPPAAVHAQHELAAGRHGETIGMIELVTRDVQVTVPPYGFSPSKLNTLYSLPATQCAISEVPISIIPP